MPGAPKLGTRIYFANEESDILTSPVSPSFAPPRTSSQHTRPRNSRLWEHRCSPTTCRPKLPSVRHERSPGGVRQDAPGGMPSTVVWFKAYCGLMLFSGVVVFAVGVALLALPSMSAGPRESALTGAVMGTIYAGWGTVTSVPISWRSSSDPRSGSGPSTWSSSRSACSTPAAGRFRSAPDRVEQAGDQSILRGVSAHRHLKTDAACSAPNSILNLGR